MKAKHHHSEVLIDMPLFNFGKEYTLPKSPTNFKFESISRDVFMPLNGLWHSRLPQCMNAFEGFFYGANYEGKYYAVAWWSKPVARMLNGRDWLELRRMAICDDAPRYTATWMLAKMRRDIREKHPEVVKLISYQDTEVHTGTIYKADNWHIGAVKKNIKTGWQTRESNRQNQSSADKIRWEYDLGGN